VPIGVQFDQYAQSDVLPWAVRVHFRQVPDTLVRPAGPDFLKLHFNAMLKQAEYLRTGAIRKLMGMPPHEQNRLWEGLRTRTSPYPHPATDRQADALTDGETDTMGDLDKHRHRERENDARTRT
jgi:hypothetical protein